MKTLTKRQGARLLREAANRIGRYGFIKNQFGNKSVGFCLAGSIGGSHDFSRRRESLWYYPILSTLGTYLYVTKQIDSLATYNDQSHTTKEDATRLLRGCARWLEHGGRLEK